MMVVQSSTSKSPRTKASILSSSSRSGIWPCATTTRTSGTMLREQLGDAADRAHAVVDEEDLPAAPHLAQDRLADQALVEAAHLRAHRDAVGRRRLDHRQVAQPAKAIWSVRGIGVAVSVSTSTVSLQLLDALLVRDAEAVLLVDHEQAEVLEDDVLLEQRVRADHEVDPAAREAVAHGARLLRRREARERLDRDGEALEAAPEGLEVLLAEHRGGHQHGHLLAGHHRPGARRARRPRSCRSRRRRTPAGPSAAARARSASTSSIAASWSGVSSYGKAASNSSSARSRGGNAKPGWSSRAACTASSSLRHVAHAPAHAGLGALPGDAAELVDLGQRRRRRPRSAGPG